MKKVILLFALFIIATIGANAQNDMFFVRYAKPDYIILSSYEGYDDDIMKMELEYIDNAIRFTAYIWDIDEWIMHELVYEQAYNAEMDVVRETYYYKTEEGELIPYKEYLFEYDYNYDRDGRVSEYDFGFGDIESSTWHQSPALSTIQYNDKGLRESAHIYYAWIDTEDPEYDEVDNYEAFYSYDDSGNIIKEERIFNETDYYQYHELYEYYYGADGRVSSMDFSTTSIRWGEPYESGDITHIDFYYNSVSIPEIKKDIDASVCISNESLVIRSGRAEEVSIYSVTGSKLCTIKKEAGEISVPASSFANQVLIVKGEGWAKKAVISKQ